MTTAKSVDDTRPLAWWRTLGPRGRRAFVGSAGGWALDSYDVQILPLALTALSAALGITAFAAGLLNTMTLLTSAFGGILAGILADRIGRTRTLMLTVAVYACFTVLCGFAPNYETLLVFRALQGLGFGGEWAAGAVLIAEYAHGRYRGRVLAYVQSAWSLGWGLALLGYTVIFGLFSPELAWRVLFWTGALPALLLLYLRRNVVDAPIARHTRARDRASGPGSGPGLLRRTASLFRGGLARTTLLACLLATGAQGGYYALATWLPAFLGDERGLATGGIGGYMLFVIAGSFAGYVSAGYTADLLGRKWTFTLFAAASGALLLAYVRIPTGASDLLVMLLGFPLGFFSSGIFSGFGAYLAELFPTAYRGTGQGFCYNIGRGIGAAFPALVGAIAMQFGLGGAMGVGTAAYGLAVLALLGLPETRGRDLAELETEPTTGSPAGTDPDGTRSPEERTDPDVIREERTP